ncbi:MAG TPA: hypothetical protein VKJ01_26625 [Candidatus Solibacter sp.]|nr:hypothetical protein [Candidatus Solibacter sp.]
MLDGLTQKTGESSVPPYVQRFVARKKTVEGIAVGETSRFESGTGVKGYRGECL